MPVTADAVDDEEIEPTEDVQELLPPAPEIVAGIEIPNETTDEPEVDPEEVDAASGHGVDDEETA